MCNINVMIMCNMYSNININNESNVYYVCMCNV